MQTYTGALWSMPIETITLAHVLDTLTASKHGGTSVPKKMSLRVNVGRWVVEGP